MTLFQQPKQEITLLVFDIETVPLKDEEYSDVQRDLIKRRLDQAVLRNPDVDKKAKEGEIRATDPYLGKIVCIGVYFPQKNIRTAIINEREVDILSTFWAQLVGYNGLYITYNGTRFDVPFILRRSMKYGIKPTNPSFLSYTKYNPMPPHFDVMVQLSGGRETAYSLKQACDFFGIPSPKDGAVQANNVAEAYEQGRIQDIADYCLRDLESTYQLFELVRNYTQT